MKNIIVTFILFLVVSHAYSQEQHRTFINPILPGGYPDPSICRVGDDYYIINSSFEYFPGLPIHHSRDLVNWELVGYALHCEEQADILGLKDVQTKGGIHAPTIRYHKGLFYVITTSVYDPVDKSEGTKFYNFVITAEDVKGPWSEPHILEGAPGIDPDIFFDDDGKVWYVGTHSPENPNFSGEGEIWLQEIDTHQWKLIGERYYLWRGACGGVWVEGPHIYKRNGMYYLLVAEGGTSFNHAVMIAASTHVTGPYVANKRNPILTTRHLSYDNWVHSTGHADMVELQDGRWYMVALGIRGDIERGTNMGRETHLIPIEWEQEPFEWLIEKKEWPVIAPQTGKIERTTTLPFQSARQYRNTSYYDNFDTKELSLEWNFRRIPPSGTISLTSVPGNLRLYGTSSIIKERGQYSFIGFRQKQSFFEFQAKMSFQTNENGTEAGVVHLQDDDNFVALTVVHQRGRYSLELTVNERKKERKKMNTKLLPDYKGNIIFKVEASKNEYNYYYSLDEGLSFVYLSTLPIEILISHGYTGAYLGLYVSGNEKPTKAYADFDWIKYKDFE